MARPPRRQPPLPLPLTPCLPGPSCPDIEESPALLGVCHPVRSGPRTSGRWTSVVGGLGRTRVTVTPVQPLLPRWGCEGFRPWWPGPLYLFSVTVWSGLGGVTQGFVWDGSGPTGQPSGP